MDAIRIILASIKKADSDFNLINDKDRIAIGVSGGKDSMALLYALSLYKRFSKIDFEIIPINIDLGFPNYNELPIKEYCASLGLDLIVADGKSVYEILKEQQRLQNKTMLPCSICSRMKKAIINKKANELNCNKVSFAHHKTDAIETLFLNEIYGGRIATFEPKMFLENEGITFIRPFIYIDEKEIIRLVKEKNIPIFPSNCPNDKKTKREDIKQLLLSLNKTYPASYDNFLTMLSNKEKFNVFFLHEENKVNNSGLFYKKIIDFCKVFDEKAYIKVSDTISKNSEHFHLYQGDELVGIILLSHKEKAYTIEKIWVKTDNLFVPFVFKLYWNISLKINPITFSLKGRKYINEAKKLCFKKQKGSYLLDMNPRNLDAYLKKQNLI